MCIRDSFITVTFIGIWIASLLLGEQSYQNINLFFSSFLGKFFCLGIIWSFSFQMLSEIRHLFMDLGYGFEPKITKITGIVVLIGSFPLTVIIFVIGRVLI